MTHPREEALGTMESRGSEHSPAPLPLRQRQLPLPFILPEKLGPLPAPETRPAIPAIGIRGELPARELHPGLTSHASGRGQYRDTRHGSSYPAAIFRPRPPPPSLQTSPPPLLPPPLPTPPFRPNTSPGGRQSAEEVGLPSNARETLLVPLWPNAGGHNHETLHYGYTAPEAPSNNHAPTAARYRCDRCPETFHSNGALKRHGRLHLETTYRCACGSAYTDMSVLRVSTAKLFICSEERLDTS